MSGHGHSHNCGGCDDHDHVTDAERAAAYSLYLKIDTERVQCLNETIDGSGKDVFKPWDKRFDKEKVKVPWLFHGTGETYMTIKQDSADIFVESDADEELLFNIPFTGSVKLKGIILIGGEEDTNPSVMKLYKNRQNMTFDDCGAEPDQVFELHRDPSNVLEYSTKVARFNGVDHLSIYFPSNFGADNTKVYYIGLKGDFTEAHRHEVTICNYEAWANPSDHKASFMDSVQHPIN